MQAVLDPPLSLWFFESRQEGESEGSPDQKTVWKRRYLVCRFCKAKITSTAARIEMKGSHEHTFFNPAGVVYRIGCFVRAPGCMQDRQASDEFTWFPGHRWRIASCRKCGCHLGWSFSGTGSGFFGLILNRILPMEQDEPGPE